MRSPIFIHYYYYFFFFSACVFDTLIRKMHQLTEEDWKDPVYEGVLRKKGTVGVLRFWFGFCALTFGCERQTWGATGARGHLRKKWTTRYFRIKNGSMFWFKDRNSTKLKGHIPLDDAVVEVNTPKTNTQLNCWKLYCKILDKSYYLVADDRESVKGWIHAIQSQARLGLYKQLLKKHEGRMFVPSDDDDEEDDDPALFDRRRGPSSASPAAAQSQGQGQGKAKTASNKNNNASARNPFMSDDFQALDMSDSSE
jgi:hypothetical protein